jgi:hypothetical protein
MAYALNGIVGLVSLVCFILVVVKMFQTGKTGLGIVTIILVFCVGIGGLIALIWGWIKAQELKMVPLMLVWTGAIILGIVLSFAFPIEMPFLKK